MSMCALAKTLSLSNMRKDLKPEVIYYQVHTSIRSQGPCCPISALCALYRLHLAFSMKISLRLLDLRELYSISPGEGSVLA